MIYRIRHQTTYTYLEPAELCHNLLHLAPRPVPNQECRDSSIHIEPAPARITEFADTFGNQTSFFTIQEPHRQLTIIAEQETVVHPRARPASSLPWQAVRDELRRKVDAYQFTFDSHYVQTSSELAEYARASFTPGRTLLDAALDLSRRIHADFRFDPAATTVTSPLSQVFNQRAGVCQDFAHLQIGCLRSLGLAARYVSGYLRTTPPPGQPRLVGADASHAWVGVFCPQAGWFDVDPTNNKLVSDQHITLAWGRDYDDVSPVKGVVLSGGRQGVSVAVDVVPVEDP